MVKVYNAIFIFNTSNASLKRREENRRDKERKRREKFKHK
jgi:hypothetical protein